MRRLEFEEILESSLPSKTCVSVYLPSVHHLDNYRAQNVQMQSVMRTVKKLSHHPNDDSTLKIVDQFAEDCEAIKRLQQDHGVAWFSSEQISGFIPTQWQSPALAVVADSFHVKPLLREYQCNRPFHVLTLGQNHVKLFTRWNQNLQLVDQMSIGQEERGILDEDRASLSKQRLRSLRIRAANTMIHRSLSQSTTPLLLAGAQSSVLAVKKSLSYPYLLEQTIACNPDQITLQELQDRASQKSNDYFEFEEDQAIANSQYCYRSGKSLQNIREIAKAGVEGRIDQLIVAEDYHVWGELDRKTGAIQIRANQTNSKDGDLLDDIGEMVVKFKGSVWVVKQEKLGNRPLIATLRW